MSAGERALRELRELDERSGGRRVAWTDTWAQERRRWADAVAALPGVSVDQDAAGNLWARLPGREPGTVVAGSHLDCVPGGGWLDGCLGVLGATAALRELAERPDPPRHSVAVVDWADEEGARFGHSLLGSSAACGLLDVAHARTLRDADGVALPDALAEHGVDLDRVDAATSWLDDARAYVELHIEQGPVLEAEGRAAAGVSGCLGVRRHRIVLHGREAHAGASPMDDRRDPVLAAAAIALLARDAAVELGGLATVGALRALPGTPTAIAASCDLTLDLRHRELDGLVALERRVLDGADDAARRERVELDAELIWSIDPVAFDGGLVERARAATGGGAPLVSGPLHDAAACARAGVPTAMLFIRSRGGVSHSREEDSDEADVIAGVDALVQVVGTLADE
jgi:N-carbamoyl-L-amino-acid hydrolase